MNIFRMHHFLFFLFNFTFLHRLLFVFNLCNSSIIVEVGRLFPTVSSSGSRHWNKNFSRIVFVFFSHHQLSPQFFFSAFVCKVRVKVEIFEKYSQDDRIGFFSAARESFSFHFRNEGRVLALEKKKLHRERELSKMYNVLKTSQKKKKTEKYAQDRDKFVSQKAQKQFILYE